MINNLESQKEKLKGQLLQEIDEYFEKFERSSKEAGFDINKIEKLMIEQDSKIKKILETSNSELTSAVEVAVKKNVRNAKVSSKKQKSERN